MSPGEAYSRHSMNAQSRQLVRANGSLFHCEFYRAFCFVCFLAFLIEWAKVSVENQKKNSHFAGHVGSSGLIGISCNSVEVQRRY